MKRTILLALLVLAACGRPPESGEPPGETPAVEAPAPSVPTPTPELAPEKSSAKAVVDTAASEAYHTTILAGRAGYPPGSGALVEVPDRDKKAMVSAAMGFFAAARVENTDAMRDVSTELFRTNLIDNLDRYHERFYGGLRASLASALGGVEAGEVRMPDEGHFEIELKFADQTSRRLMMAVESGHWRINRL